MSEKLKNDILQIKEIGEKIAELSTLSKKLRAEIAGAVVECGLGTVNEDHPIEFMLDGLPYLVSITKAKEVKDYNVTFKAIKMI